MKDFLLQILADPLSGEELIYNKEKKFFYTKTNGSIYPVPDEIPVILINPQKPVESILHRNMNTAFNYADHYQKDALTFNYFSKIETRATRSEIKRLHQAIIKKIDANAQLILDAGCGNGWLAQYFLNKNKKIISMDISIENPLKALQSFPGENHAALTADVFHLPLKNNSVDCIVASEIIEHVYDPNLFVKKLVDILKPGGKLIITTPYNEKIEYFLCVHCNLPTPKNAHLHSFNKKNITAILNHVNANWKGKLIANKYLIKTRMNVLLDFLPFNLWSFFDSMTNKILHSPTRFIIEIIKK